MTKNNLVKKKTAKTAKKLNPNVLVKAGVISQPLLKRSSSTQTIHLPEIINHTAIAKESSLETLPLKEHWRSIKTNCKNYPNIYSYAKKLKAEFKLSKKALKVSVRETRTQKSAFAEYQGKINKLVTCSICFDIYSQPHVLECGHVHCYFCLKNWIGTFENNGSCPTCRKSLSIIPIPSISVQQLVDLSIEGLEGEAKAVAVKRLMDDKLKMPQNGDLWSGWVKTGSRYIQDSEDDVGRCMECGWEIVDGECAHCGLVYTEFNMHEGLGVFGDSSSISSFSGREGNESSDSDLDDFVERDDVVLFESDREDPLNFDDEDSAQNHGEQGTDHQDGNCSERDDGDRSDSDSDACPEHEIHSRSVIYHSDSENSRFENEVEVVSNQIFESDVESDNEILSSPSRGTKTVNRIIFSDDDE